MARAPRPGTTPNAPAEATEGGVRITVNGQVADIVTADIGPRDDAVVRLATRDALGYKITLLAALRHLNAGEEVGLDTICVLWWFGLQKAGATMTLTEALDQFPSLGEFVDAVEIEQFDGVDDPEEHSPEA